MTTRCRILLLLALLLVGSPQQLRAQEGGLGGIMDFIQRLSGPRFAGIGFTGKFPIGWQNLSLRVNAVHRQSFDEREQTRGDDVTINMWTAQPMLELDLPGLPLAVAAGLGIHRFTGNVDPFTHLSIPLQARWVRLLRLGPVHLNAGPGLHLFAPFDDGDFQPLQLPLLERDRWEAVLTAFLEIEVVF